MNTTDRAVAFMPIRLNSQRIENKSIVEILGRPMFCWSLETLDNVGIETYVYTNEIDKLKNLIDFSTKNVKFIDRPKYLDLHTTKGIDIYKEFSSQIISDIYLLAHCTSPFVKLNTYKKLVKSVADGTYDSSCTVQRKQTFCWYGGKKLNFSVPRPKTQEIEPVFVETSAAYCYRRSVLNKNSRSSEKHCLIESFGVENFDIDNLEDLEIFNILK